MFGRAKVITPSHLDASILPDGTVALELLNGHYSTLAQAESNVKDQAHLSEVVRTWAHSSFTEERKRMLARRELTHNYAGAFTLIISSKSSTELDRLAPWAHDLAFDFPNVFGSPTQPLSEERVERYCNTVARNLHTVLTAAQAKSRERLRNRSYRAVLEEYLRVMKSKTSINDQDYYNEWQRTIGAIMADERYLLLAESDPDRRLYNKILAEASNLYNWHQDLARGGIARSR